MDLDRHYIERKDFTVARRGYDQEEVDLHLRQLADAISELKAQLKATPAGVAGAAAEQVRQIVEAAEESAAQIEERANAEARRVTDDASRRARETRERADQEAAEQLQRVQETAAKMLDRAAALERDLDTLVQGIHDGAAGLVDRMRSGAGDLEGELGSIRQELLTVRPAAEPEPEPELAPATEQFDTNGGEPAAASVPEPEPEPEPQTLAEAMEEESAAEEAEIPTPAAPQSGATSVAGSGPEGARLVALNMALNGTPREEAARYLADNFQLEDQEAILDDVYSRVGGRA
ncbi:MAG TPA: DivIVA domain-containing protein [Thermoleophilaceae bacterium]